MFFDVGWVKHGTPRSWPAPRGTIENSGTCSQGFDSATRAWVPEPTISPGSLHAPYGLLPLLAVGKVMIKAVTLCPSERSGYLGPVLAAGATVYE